MMTEYFNRFIRIMGLIGSLYGVEAEVGDSPAWGLRPQVWDAVVIYNKESLLY